LHKDITFAPTETDAIEFTVSYWKVDPGARVCVGDELLVVESVEEKTALTVQSPYSGTLAEVTACEGATLAPGDLVGRIEVE
jgi:pyruvate/2-oxoglutarate dehydrogenase complex dihydrolipoamide acyltransferase (E2) component